MTPRTWPLCSIRRLTPPNNRVLLSIVPATHSHCRAAAIAVKRCHIMSPAMRPITHHRQVYRRAKPKRLPSSLRLHCPFNNFDLLSVNNAPPLSSSPDLILLGDILVSAGATIKLLTGIIVPDDGTAFVSRPSLQRYQHDRIRDCLEWLYAADNGQIRAAYQKGSIICLNDEKRRRAKASRNIKNSSAHQPDKKSGDICPA